jgi:hypothetical protein
MPKLTLETDEQRTAFAPGHLIRGVAGWELDAPPAWVELRLFWRTTGRGDSNLAVAATQRWEQPPAVDAQLFAITAPLGPLSFSGKLICLQWGLELVPAKGKDAARIDLVIAPELRELDLTAEPPEFPRIGNRLKRGLAQFQTLNRTPNRQ